MGSEFKQFLLKTNVLALALAFIIGVALAAVVNSLVKDIIMPPVGLL
ncbi:MAG: MscL family protein, partial [Chloroflexi bacterium]